MCRHAGYDIDESASLLAARDSGHPPSRGGNAKDHSMPPSPSLQHATRPISGFRIPLSHDNSFPTGSAGPPIGRDVDGKTPVYIGSAIIESPHDSYNSMVHPCKIIPSHPQAPALVPLNHHETRHYGRYDLLLYDETSMEWVATSQGQIPSGRRPIPGGYRLWGKTARGNWRSVLYHALAEIGGVVVPGVTAEYLVSISPTLPPFSLRHSNQTSALQGVAYFTVQGEEVKLKTDYRIL